jgi:hypothetical protein
MQGPAVQAGGSSKCPTTIAKRRGQTRLGTAPGQSFTIRLLKSTQSLQCDLNRPTRALSKAFWWNQFFRFSLMWAKRDSAALDNEREMNKTQAWCCFLHCRGMISFSTRSENLCGARSGSITAAPASSSPLSLALLSPPLFGLCSTFQRRE